MTEAIELMTRINTVKDLSNWYTTHLNTITQPDSFKQDGDKTIYSFNAQSQLGECTLYQSDGVIKLVRGKEWYEVTIHIDHLIYKDYKSVELQFILNNVCKVRGNIAWQNAYGFTIGYEGLFIWGKNFTFHDPTLTIDKPQCIYPGYTNGTIDIKRFKPEDNIPLAEVDRILPKEIDRLLYAGRPNCDIIDADSGHRSKLSFLGGGSMVAKEDGNIRFVPKMYNWISIMVNDKTCGYGAMPDGTYKDIPISIGQTINVFNFKGQVGITIIDANVLVDKLYC